MENSVELRLCLLGPAGRGWSLLSGFFEGGSDAECEWAGFDFVFGGDVGLGCSNTKVSGSLDPQISQLVRSGWLRKVHCGQAFFLEDVDSLSSGADC